MIKEMWTIMKVDHYLKDKDNYSSFNRVFLMVWRSAIAPFPESPQINVF